PPGAIRCARGRDRTRASTCTATDPASRETPSPGAPAFARTDARWATLLPIARANTCETSPARRDSRQAGHGRTPAPSPSRDTARSGWPVRLRSIEAAPGVYRRRNVKADVLVKPPVALA